MPLSSQNPPDVTDETPTQSRVGHYRWIICALLFFATTINYVDRQVFSILAPDLQKSFGWTETEYSNIVMAFQAAYGFGLLAVGRLMDRLGTRAGFSFSIILWSLACMGHAFARTVFGFAFARFALGAGESGNFPAAIKTTAEWFPKKERAFAAGIFNAGSNVGAILAPLTVPWMAINWGWQSAFIITGAAGFLWLIAWLIFYRPPEKHPKISPAELAYIQSDAQESAEKIPWRKLFPHRQTWAFALGKFITDPVWWFFLFWLPKYFSETYKLKLTGLAGPLIAIYIAADFGSIGGGWISSRLIKKGWTVNRARKTAMLICALCVVPMILAPHTHDLWMTVAIISLAAAAHQGWSANLFTLVSDTFPKRAVASVVGIGGLAGAVGGMITSEGIGHVLAWTKNDYGMLLTITGFAYVLALLVIHLLVPKLKPAKVESIS